MLVAIAFVACNEKPQHVAEETPEATVEAVAGAQTQADSAIKTATERTPEEVVKSIEDAKAKCNFVPSGDIDKDAQDFVDMQLALAVKAADGKDTQEENDRVTAIMHILGEYYTNKGRQAEFQAKLGLKLQEGMAKIKQEQK